MLSTTGLCDKDKSAEEWHIPLTEGNKKLGAILAEMEPFKLSKDEVPLVIRLIENPKFNFLTAEEQKDQGYVYVDTSFDNYNRDENIIEKLSEEFKNNALNEIKQDYKEIEENIIKENTPNLNQVKNNA